MKPTRKRRSLVGLVHEAEEVLREGLLGRGLPFLREVRVKLRDLPKTNFELGSHFAAQGQWFDAALRFRMTLYLQSDYPGAWYRLGCAYARQNRLPQARAALRRALAQTPADPETLFMLALLDPLALTPEQTPTRMPQSVVTEFFTGLAPHDEALEARQAYQGGTAVWERARPHCPGEALTVVDLGCGTGLAARPWREVSRRLLGLDLTPRMAAEAKKAQREDRPLFDAVRIGDAAALTEGDWDGTADLVLAVQLAPFLGALEGLCQGAARLLVAGGVLAVTLDPWTGPGPFGLVPETGRFGHSADYLTAVSAAAGFCLIETSAVSLYPETAPALLMLLRKESSV